MKGSPETSGFRPQEEFSEEGFDAIDQEWFEAGRELYEGEEDLKAAAHDALVTWRKEHGERRPPRELLLAVALTSLFVNTTELASVSFEEGEPPVASDTKDQDPVPVLSQDELARLSRNPFDKSSSVISVSQFGRGNEWTGGLFVETPVDVGSVIDGDPIVFTEPASSLSIDRLVSLGDVGRLTGAHSPNVAELESRGSTLSVFTDENNNRVWASYTFDETTEVVHERVDVHVAWVFSGEDEAKPVPLDVDLTDLGYGSIEGAFYAPPLVKVGEDHGYHYFSSEHTELETQEIMEERGEEIADGIQEALSLFGLPHDKVTGVTIIDRPFENAYAAPQTKRVIYFTDEILKSSGQKGLWERLKEGEGLTEEAVAAVAAHEVFHQIDAAYKISDDSEITKLFERLTADELFRMNEMRDGKLFGGHAQDNNHEMFASFMNTIRGDHWERRLSWLTPEDILVYEEVVDVFSERLKQIPALEGAPIHGVLQERQETLNDLIRDFRAGDRVSQ